jgi:hypothetical protein
VTHTNVPPQAAMNLVADLNANRGKGAAIFQKRKARSEKWVVDENNVKKTGYQPTSTYIGVCLSSFSILIWIFAFSQQVNHGVKLRQHHGLVMKHRIQGLCFLLFDRNLTHPPLLLYLNQFFHLHQHKLVRDTEILMLNQKGLVLGMLRVRIYRDVLFIILI